MGEKIIIDEVWVKASEEEMLLELYLIGPGVCIHYEGEQFELIEKAGDMTGFEPSHTVKVPFQLTQIRWYEGMGNHFLMTSTGSLLRTNIRDFGADRIYEELTYHPWDPDPRAYYQTLMKWYKEATIVHLG